MNLWSKKKNFEIFSFITLCVLIGAAVLIFYSQMTQISLSKVLVSEKFSWHSIFTLCCLVAQSCPTLRNPVDCSPSDFSVHWILQARILEWVAISFSSIPPLNFCSF